MTNAISKLQTEDELMPHRGRFGHLEHVQARMQGQHGQSEKNRNNDRGRVNNAHMKQHTPTFSPEDRRCGTKVPQTVCGASQSDIHIDGFDSGTKLPSHCGNRAQNPESSAPMVPHKARLGEAESSKWKRELRRHRDRLPVPRLIMVARGPPLAMPMRSYSPPVSRGCLKNTRAFFLLY